MRSDEGLRGTTLEMLGSNPVNWDARSPAIHKVQIYRRFDHAVIESLGAARSLNVNALDSSRILPIRSWPARWVYAALVVA